jgi:hypothetical protein
MNPVLPFHPKPQLPDARLPDRPSTRSLLRWGALVLALHLGVLLSLAGALDLQLSSPQTLRTGPMQTRTIPAPAGSNAATDPGQTPAARTRVALVENTQSTPKSDATKPAAALQRTPADKAANPPALPEPEQNPDPDPTQTTGPSTNDPVAQQNPATQPNTNDNAEKAIAAASGTQASESVLAETPIAGSRPAPSSSAQLPSPNQSLPLAGNAPASAPLPADGPQPSPINTPPNVKAQASEPILNTHQSVAPIDAAAKPATPQPERIVNATMALPEMALGSLPPSALLSYRLSGQEKGIHYQASGELRWQHNDNAYAMSLSVKAFLLGSRHWRSVGQINATGLAPTRFSDSWRSERAAHFDRPNQRILFSSNAPAVALQPGAQDQASLYVQLAAAMAQSGQRMTPGTRLQIQTATVRDALPWLLTLEKLETLQVDGQNLQAVKWVCQPRNRFDAQVEFWVTAAHDWLPARIRITQVSGSFIDLQLTGRVTLVDLPPVQ